MYFGSLPKADLKPLSLKVKTLLYSGSVGANPNFLFGPNFALGNSFFILAC
jgi:hypothetical protein